MKQPDLFDFEDQIYQNWAEYAGCTRQDLVRTGTILLPTAGLNGSTIIAIWSIARHSLVQLDPELLDPVNTVLADLPKGTSLTGDHLESAWGGQRIQERDLGLVHYLFPDDLPDFSTGPGFRLRQLTAQDTALMADLHQACPPVDVDEGFVEVDHLIAFGCFAGSQLVAAASGYIRTGFLDLGVLVHPDFRRQGLGKAAVGALCQWSIERGTIAQYRCNPLNIASQRLALGLGFKLYFQSESIWLK